MPQVTRARTGRRTRRLISALVALTLLLGSVTAQDGSRAYGLLFYKGDTTRDVNWTQAYYLEATLIGRFETMLTALAELMPQQEPGQHLPITPPLEQCDDLLYEFWAAVGRKNMLTQLIIDSIGAMLFDSDGEPTDAYYLLVDRQREMANMDKVIAMVLNLMTNFGCPTLPSQPL